MGGQGIQLVKDEPMWFMYEKDGEVHLNAFFRDERDCALFIQEMIRGKLIGGKQHGL